MIDASTRLKGSVVALTIGLAFASSAEAQHPAFRSGVELVALGVSVFDGKHQFIRDLDRSDFEVYENGVRREVAFFGPAETPVDIIVLIDCSASMADRFEVVAHAATGFFRTLRETDRAAVIGFANHVSVLQSFTGDAVRLQHAVRRPEASGKTALYDALYIAAHEFRRERTYYTQIRRQALVVLSDGQDTASLADQREALEAIRGAGMTVFTISPEPRLPLGQLPFGLERLANEAAFLLMTLARETGGRSFFLEDLQRLAKVYSEISTELQHQYTLGYEPDNLRWGDRFRHLLVRVVPHPEAIVRTRRGYGPRRDD